MFRIRILCTAALLALIGCVPAQPVTPTTGALALAAAVNPMAPAVITPASKAAAATPEPLPTPELSHDEDLSQTPFMLRNFGPDFETDFKGSNTEVITRLRDDDLQGFRCTHTYHDAYPAEEPDLVYRDDVTRILQPLTDATMVELVASITDGLDGTQQQRVGVITVCETETQQQIVLYSGGQYGDRPYIGVVNSGKVVQIAAPDVEGIYLATCQRVLAVDRSENLYYQCSGGDGPGHSDALYRVNLISHENTRLVYCRYNPDLSYCR